MVFTARLGVVKQSFFGLPGQYGRRMTKANYEYITPSKRRGHCARSEENSHSLTDEASPFYQCARANARAYDAKKFA